MIETPGTGRHFEPDSRPSRATIRTITGLADLVDGRGARWRVHYVIDAIEEVGGPGLGEAEPRRDGPGRSELRGEFEPLVVDPAAIAWDGPLRMVVAPAVALPITVDLAGARTWYPFRVLSLSEP